MANAMDMASLHQSQNLLKELESRDAEIQKKKREQEKLNLIQKLGSLIQGYKTRRILKDHQVVRKLRVEYSDLLSFAFGLQLELRQLKPAT